VQRPVGDKDTGADFFKEHGGDSTLFDGEGDVEVVDAGGRFTYNPLEMIELELL